MRERGSGIAKRSGAIIFARCSQGTTPVRSSTISHLRPRELSLLHRPNHHQPPRLQVTQPGKPCYPALARPHRENNYGCIYKPVSRSSFCPSAEASLIFLRRRCSGSICSSLSVSTLTITGEVASAPSSVLWGRNMAMTFETIPPAADSSGVSMGVSPSRSGLQELAREWERDCERRERPIDMM